MGLAAVGHYRLLGPLTAGDVFMASDRIGQVWRGLRNRLRPETLPETATAPFNIL